MKQPLILFGAYDRHNFGDLLFPHVAQALLGGKHDAPILHAGLASRDLSPFGGHRVVALHELLARWGGHAFRLVHVGGEILTCEAWQAAAMLQPPDEAPRTIAYLAQRPEERTTWTRNVLHTDALAPYVVGRADHPALSGIVHNAVGGVALDRLAGPMREEVLAKLRTADAVCVRDAHTLGHLHAAGLHRARLLPDCAAMIAALFGPLIEARGMQGEAARIRAACPDGHVAVQFSADFNDDHSLRTLAAQLDEVAARTGLRIVLFRAGAAPWHDDLESLHRVKRWMHPGTAQVFVSLNVWDICALIAHSRGYAGSSLHGRIVAMAHGLPRVNIASPQHDGTHMSKAASYAATWDIPDLPGDVPITRLAHALFTWMAAPPQEMARVAREGVERCRAAHPLQAWAHA